MNQTELNTRHIHVSIFYIQNEILPLRETALITLSENLKVVAEE